MFFDVFNTTPGDEAEVAARHFTFGENRPAAIMAMRGGKFTVIVLVTMRAVALIATIVFVFSTNNIATWALAIAFLVETAMLIIYRCNSWDAWQPRIAKSI